MVFIISSYSLWSKSKQDFEKGYAHIAFRMKLPGKGKKGQKLSSLRNLELAVMSKKPLVPSQATIYDQIENIYQNNGILN